MSQLFVAFTFACCCLSSMAWAQGDQVTAPDPAEINQAGQVSMKRLETESASWTTRTITPTGTDFIVEVTLTPYVRSTVIPVEGQGRRQGLARVTMTADVWYVV